MELMKGRIRGADAALIGLAIAFFTLAGPQGDPRPIIVYPLLLVFPLVLLATGLTRRPWLAVIYLLILGILIRTAFLDHGYFGSDVLPIAEEAIDVLLDGGNPYGHEYFVSPNPFAFPPGNLLYYLPGFLLGDMRATEIFAAGTVLVGLAWAAWLIRNDWPVAAMGLYAATPPLIELATDGSNDTSAGALLFVSALLLLVARRQSNGGLLLLSALLMGETLAFKLYTLPFWPFLVAYLGSQPWRLSLTAGASRSLRASAWLAYASVSAGFAGLVSLPFFLWSPTAFVDDLLSWSSASIHPIEGWNVWAFLLRWQGWNAQSALGDYLPPIDTVLMLAAIIIGLLIGVRRPSRALLFGVVTWFVLMFFARWTTYAYFAGVAPVVLLIPFADQLVEPPESREKAEKSPVTKADLPVP